MNEKGYRFRGKLITSKTFDKYFVNPKYTGEFTFGGRVCNNMYPQIISKEIFDGVQKRLAQNRYTLGGKETAKAPYLLTGKLFCGHCGTESQVFVSDDNTVVYFNIRGGKNIETITFEDNKTAVENLTKVQTQLPLSRHE